MIASIKIDLAKWVEIEPRLLENEKHGIFELIVENLVHYGVPPTANAIRRDMNMTLNTWEKIGKDLCAALCLEEEPREW